MPSRLRDNIDSRYFEAANALRGKKSRRRIVAYVESYDDIYFWRTVLSRFENNNRYFEVMLPSKGNLTRGKKSVLMNFVGEHVGPDMIACVDADYDYLLQGVTEQSRRVLESPYVFHTYVYAIENFQCYVPSLHDVCATTTASSTFKSISDFTANHVSPCLYGRFGHTAQDITAGSRSPISIELLILAVLPYKPQRHPSTICAAR